MRLPEPFDPESVIAAVLRGETDQFRLLVREYGLLLRAFIGARLYHQEDVEDLAQEVFLTAYEKLETCVPGNFRDWLIGIARNHLNNHWRKTSRRANAMECFRQEVASVIAPELDQANEELEPNRLERLLDCIAQLPLRARRIVRGGLEGTRAERLAEELGMTPNSVYQARYRAHAALRQCMDTQ